MNKIKIGIIGFGRMGEKYVEEMLKSGEWQIEYICDPSEFARKRAALVIPQARYITDEDIIFNDPTIEAVGLFTLADLRCRQIKKAVATGKHILAEKPIAYNVEKEWEAVQLVENSNVFSAVNLYLRNSSFTHAMKEFAASGEIGELAIIRICHMTPGLAPGEGHEFEGPSFHDCGMHYVDIARWFAESDFRTGHAQAIRMWDYKEPWWLQCHGTFENGIVFDVTQGFVYGQLSKDQTHNSYMELIGTKGFCRMTHDFKTAVVDLRGVTVTDQLHLPHGGKNIGQLCHFMAESIRTGKLSDNLPQFRESAIASEFSWKMLEDCRKNDLPSIGNEKTLEEIRYRRAHMTNGYGLLHQRGA